MEIPKEGMVLTRETQMGETIVIMETTGKSTRQRGRMPRRRKKLKG
jgi:hypothetical protein